MATDSTGATTLAKAEVSSGELKIVRWVREDQVDAAFGQPLEYLNTITMQDLINWRCLSLIRHHYLLPMSEYILFLPSSLKFQSLDYWTWMKTAIAKPVSANIRTVYYATALTGNYADRAA